MRSHPDGGIVVRPPKVKGKSSSITTGALNRIDENGNTREFIMTGPPCSLFPIVDFNTKTVKYAKASLRMVRECELEEEEKKKLHPFALERAQFTEFIRGIEDKVLQKVRDGPETFFGKPILSDRVTLTSCIKPPTNPEWAAIMSMKLMVDGTQRENIVPENVQLVVRNVDGKSLRLDQLRRGDIVLPMINGAYPYYAPRGDVGVQFKLYGLQIIVRGEPDTRDLTSLDENEGIRCDNAMLKYMQMKRPVTLEGGASSDDDGDGDAALPPSKRQCTDEVMLNHAEVVG
jgi:hypothetical protein